PGDLAGVDGPVEQVEDVVAGEDALVPLAGPDGVGQDADLDAVTAQGVGQAGDGGVGVRVRGPGLEVGGEELLGGLDPGHLEHLGQRGAAVLLGAAAPQFEFRLGERRGGLLDVLGGKVGGADRAPHVGQFEVVPRGQRAAPVKDHCLYAHARMVTIRTSRTITVYAV